MSTSTPSPSGYQEQSARTKLDLIWTQILATEYTALPTREPSALGRLQMFSVKYDRVSFDHVSDELPLGRTKLVHRFGVVARVRFDVTEERDYTGFFSGSSEGLIRLSAATVAPSFNPAAALKLFVDGKPSVNVLAMNDNDGQGRNFDVFARPLSNAVTPATRFDGRLIGRAFQRTADAVGGARLYGTYLPLHHAAGTRADGTVVSEPVVPDRIVFVPLVHTSPDASPDWRTKVAALSEGTVIYRVDVAPTIDAEAEPLGTLTLTSRFVASGYGDDVLFFQHDPGPKKS